MALRSHPSAALGALIATGLALYAKSRPPEPKRTTGGANSTAAAVRPNPPRPVRPSWTRRLANVWAEMNRDHVSVMAAGVGFYALLAIFPGMSAAISLYGLVADPVTIEQHLQELAGVVPAEALKLIADQVHTLAAQPPAKLGLGLVVSLALALWSATSGTSTLMQTLTVAYEEQDDRGILHFYGLAIGLTLAMIVFGIIALLLVAVVPVVLDFLPLPNWWQQLVSFVRWPVLALFVLLGLGFLYRVAPRRHHPRWEWLSAGTIAAAVIWLAGSAGFSFYVGEFGSYDRTYGSLGAVVVLLMWFYLTAYIMLAGAELNAEMVKTRPDAPAKIGARPQGAPVGPADGTR